ncbi:MAG: hypothetical protein B7Z15_15490 [Rhizobiales bacterium 32-66-8]|nr:MAG: hypothetical protein B7Z15_15490 [Rhizobiales bacterium 32-66-8]
MSTLRRPPSRRTEIGGAGRPAQPQLLALRRGAGKGQGAVSCLTAGDEAADFSGDDDAMQHQLAASFPKQTQPGDVPHRPDTSLALHR